MKPIKPDGWLPWQKKRGYRGHRIGHDKLEGEFMIPDGFKDLGWESRPVCLVPPELLEWIEKVREHFALAYKGDYEKRADELEAELNRIWPAKKEPGKR